MVAMDCEPELAVAKRKTVSSTKMAKRLRRFVRENQLDDAGAEDDAPTPLNDNDQGVEEDKAPARRSKPASGELLCRIPEETLFQLEQIYEALEESDGVGGSGGGGGRRKSASNAPSLMSLISSSAGDGDEEEGRSATSKKRARGDEEPPATADKSSRGQDSSPKKKKKKKSRRKSNPT